MGAPDTITIPYDDDRFEDVGRYGDGNQFLAYTSYTAAKYYSTIETAPDGQVTIRRNVRQYARFLTVLHRFDPAGRYLGTDSEAFEVVPEGENQDREPLPALIAALGPVERQDIHIGLFEVEINDQTHGLIYTCQVEEGEEDVDWVLLEPNDIMFHPPWDGEYST